VFDVPVIQAMADSYQLDADIDVPGTWGELIQSAFMWRLT
jgi:hypothetical protein